MIESKMNVEQFGTYGDNTHDDTAAIQKAINECNSIVLSNIYKTTDQLSINEPTTIIGIKENKINTTLSGKKSIFKVLSNNVIFDNISAELTYSGGGSTGEDGNVISIGTYYMNAARGLENIIIRNCNLKRTGTLSYNVAIFGDTHDVIVENCKIYGECVNLHWSGDFDEAHPDTSTCTKTYHPYNVIIQNNVLENNRGVFLSSAYNVKILNNTFISNTDGITVSAGDYGNTLALGAQKNAILTGITIENCSFNEYSGKALTLNGYGYRENDLTYQKNYITHSNVLVKNSTFGDSSQNATTAIITPTLFYNLTIEGCNFKSTRQQAYYSLCSFNSVIRDCSFDVAGTPITFFGDNNSIVDHCNGVIASGYNFIRATNYTFSFTGLTYNVENLTVKNNYISGRTTLLNLSYTRNTNILENNFFDFNKALLYSTDNKNTNVVNNVLNEGSDTAQGSHYCVDLGNTDNSNFMNNYLNGARGIVVKATATNVKIVNNAMIGNVFSGGLLVAIDSRTNKDVLTARTWSGRIVNFEGSKDLIGKEIDVKILSQHVWYLKGEIVK